MSERLDARGVRIDYVIDGDGGAVHALVLHGAYSTRDEILPVLGPVLREAGVRAVYPDLPGMGESRPTTATSSNAVLDALDALVETEFGTAPFLVVGHSFGAFLGRGVAARHPDQVIGLALVSPLVDDFVAEPERVVVDDGAADQLDEDMRRDFTGYFAVRTAATRDRFLRFVVPALGRYDADAVERIMQASVLDLDPANDPYAGPMVIVAGRDDALVGWRAQARLVDVHPRATLGVVADAGHALLHERPDLVIAVIRDLLRRVGASAD